MRNTKSAPGWRTTAIRRILILGCSILAWGWVGAPPAEAANTVCVIRAHQPHPSGHFDGRINAVGEVTCVGDRVADMHLDVLVQRKVGQVWKVVGTTRRVVINKAMKVKISRSLTCRSGTYRTKARVFAQGRHHTWARSSARTINCGSGGGAGGGGGGGW